jgi:hypothetical protein
LLLLAFFSGLTACFAVVQLAGNAMAEQRFRFELARVNARECARRLAEILAATTHIGMIRERATEICIGLQDLELPAFVTLQIIDEAVHENAIRMWAKWELITAVKHFQERRHRRTATIP